MKMARIRTAKDKTNPGIRRIGGGRSDRPNSAPIQHNLVKDVPFVDLGKTEEEKPLVDVPTYYSNIETEPILTRKPKKAAEFQPDANEEESVKVVKKKRKPRKSRAKKNKEQTNE